MKALVLCLSASISTVVAACEEEPHAGRMGIQEWNDRVADVLWVGFVLLVGISWVASRWKKDPGAVPWLPLILTLFAVLHPAVLLGSDADCGLTKSIGSKIYAGVAVSLVALQVGLAVFRPSSRSV